jgi:GTPase Era involved in 16S rRNA processing
MSRPLSDAVVGNFQLGKSTLVNCLLGRNAAETGKGKSTTHRNASFPFGLCEIIDTH